MNSGFGKPKYITNELCDLLGVTHGTALCSTVIIQKILSYVKLHKLVNPDKTIMVNDELEKVFGDSGVRLRTMESHCGQTRTEIINKIAELKKIIDSASTNDDNYDSDQDDNDDNYDSDQDDNDDNYLRNSLRELESHLRSTTESLTFFNIQCHIKKHILQDAFA